MFAIDHGLISPKYILELDRTAEITGESIKGGAHVIMFNMGFAHKSVDIFKSTTSVALLINTSAPYPTTYESLGDLSKQYGVEYLFYNTRVCAELDADIVKVTWTGD